MFRAAWWHLSEELGSARGRRAVALVATLAFQRRDAGLPHPRLLVGGSVGAASSEVRTRGRRRSAQREIVTHSLQAHGRTSCSPQLPADLFLAGFFAGPRSGPYVLAEPLVSLSSVVWGRSRRRFSAVAEGPSSKFQANFRSELAFAMSSAWPFSEVARSSGDPWPSMARTSKTVVPLLALLPGWSCLCRPRDRRLLRRDRAIFTLPRHLALSFVATIGLDLVPNSPG
jgi:hypothetical protein